jgi:hypothetical protein
MTIILCHSNQFNKTKSLMATLFLLEVVLASQKFARKLNVGQSTEGINFPLLFSVKLVRQVEYMTAATISDVIKVRWIGLTCANKLQNGIQCHRRQRLITMGDSQTRQAKEAEYNN